MSYKYFRRFVSLILALALSFSGTFPASTAQAEAAQADQCQSVTGEAYPCNLSLAAEVVSEKSVSPGTQVRRVAVFDDDCTFCSQRLADVLNTDPEVVASVVTRDTVETGGLARFS